MKTGTLNPTRHKGLGATNKTYNSKKNADMETMLYESKAKIKINESGSEDEESDEEEMFVEEKAVGENKMAIEYAAEKHNINLESNMKMKKVRKSMAVPSSNAQDSNSAIGEDNDNLLYGSSITLNLINEEKNTFSKVTSRVRISERANAFEMTHDDYSINSVFRIIPASQYMMQDRILDIIDQNKIPESVDIDYQNFVSEMESNSIAYNISNKTPVKYGDKFQLYQDSSKRFL